MGVKITSNSKELEAGNLTTEGDKTTTQSMRYKLCSRGGHVSTPHEAEAHRRSSKTTRGTAAQRKRFPLKAHRLEELCQEA
jgi:hypothetical protein